MNKLRGRRKGLGLVQLGSLLLVLVMAMGVMGVSYGTWEDAVFINGYINTGTIDASLLIDDQYTDGNGVVTVSSYGDGLVLNGTGTYGVVMDYYFEEMTGDIGINFVAENTDPTLDYICEFTITNDGTVPVRVESYTVDINAGGTVTSYEFYFNGSSAGTTTIIGGDTPSVTIDPDESTGTAAAGEDVVVDVTGVVLTEPIDPGTPKSGTVTINMEEEYTELTVAITFNVVAWNQ